MSELSSINDDEFNSFLRSLGVEIHTNLFARLLNDPDCVDVLGWIYNNVDHNNSLTAREEYRYSELEKQGKVLSSEDLEAKIQQIQNEFEGLCLPGDQEGLEDVKLDISMQMEKLAMLNKQEEVLKELIQESQATNNELKMELTKLNAAEQQATDDERSAGEECVKLAEQAEAITSEVVQMLTRTLHVYGTCAIDKEISNRFFTYGPFESYKQTQKLFKSHVDLFSSLKFDKKHNDHIDEEVRTVVSEARNMEGRLSDVLCSYIETKANLYGDQAKLIVITNYDIGHPSTYNSSLEYHTSAIQILEEEQSILEQQIQSAIQQFVDRRTNLTVDNIARPVLALREQILADLSFLRGVVGEALAVDGLLYGALRRELQAAGELLSFAAHLRVYLLQEAEFIDERIKSMNQACSEQDQAEDNLSNSDIVLRSLMSILDGEPSSDPLLPVKLYNDVRRKVREINDEIQYEYRMKESALDEMRNHAKPLQKYIWDGSTSKPNCHNRGVAILEYTLTHEMASVDARVAKISVSFDTIRNGDKNNLRKLWQWFLADPKMFLEAVRRGRN